MKKATAYKKAQVATSDKLGVLLMIHDGIIKELRRARLQLMSKSPGAELALLKAQSALVELDRTLDFEAGPDLAESLHNLYLHMLLTLADVLERADIAELDRVTGLVERLRQTWSEAGAAARVRSASVGSR